ncbi:hypothetical protein DFH09DRAFT_1364675 [Mycena vulgaris]|nr:hypothetical protein DFH09DRAFT_1364675 [Mycena vulgaris]
MCFPKYASHCSRPSRRGIAGAEGYAGCVTARLFLSQYQDAADAQGRAHVKSPRFEPGVAVRVRATLLAEGAHGSPSNSAIAMYNLRAWPEAQTRVSGWPLGWGTYGGEWEADGLWPKSNADAAHETPPARCSPLPTRNASGTMHTHSPKAGDFPGSALIGCVLLFSPHRTSLHFLLAPNTVSASSLFPPWYDIPLTPHPQVLRRRRRVINTAKIKARKTQCGPVCSPKPVSPPSTPPPWSSPTHRLRRSNPLPSVSPSSDSEPSDAAEASDSAQSAESCEAEIIELRAYSAAVPCSPAAADLLAVSNVRPGLDTRLGGSVLCTGVDTILRTHASTTSSDALATRPAAACASIASPAFEPPLSTELMSSVVLAGMNHADGVAVHLPVMRGVRGTALGDGSAKEAAARRRAHVAEAFCFHPSLGLQRRWLDFRRCRGIELTLFESLRCVVIPFDCEFKSHFANYSTSWYCNAD